MLFIVVLRGIHCFLPLRIKGISPLDYRTQVISISAELPDSIPFVGRFPIAHSLASSPRLPLPPNSRVHTVLTTFPPVYLSSSLQTSQPSSNHRAFSSHHSLVDPIVQRTAHFDDPFDQFHSGLRRNETSGFALSLFRNSQHPKKSIPYLGHLIFGQLADRSLEFVVLNSLKALHVHKTVLVEKLRLADRNFVSAVSSGSGDRCAYTQRPGCIFISARHDNHRTGLRGHAEINQIDLSRFSRHRPNPAPLAASRMVAGYLNCLL